MEIRKTIEYCFFHQTRKLQLWSAMFYSFNSSGSNSKCLFSLTFLSMFEDNNKICKPSSHILIWFIHILYTHTLRRSFFLLILHISCGPIKFKYDDHGKFKCQLKSSILNWIEMKQKIELNHSRAHWNETIKTEYCIGSFTVAMLNKNSDDLCVWNDSTFSFTCWLLRTASNPTVRTKFQPFQLVRILSCLFCRWGPQTILANHLTMTHQTVWNERVSYQFMSRFSPNFYCNRIVIDIIWHGFHVPLRLNNNFRDGICVDMLFSVSVDR